VNIIALLLDKVYLYKNLQAAYEVEKKAKEDLEALDKTKNQFLLTIQHHLRTPLTSMMGYSDLLVNGAFGKQTKKTLEVIKKFQASTGGLIKMVNEFLDITQFQLGKSIIALKPGVELEPILDEIVGDLKFQTDKKGIYLKLEKPEKIFTIKADKEKLKAALQNIFDNAIKYTPEGGVTIKVESNHVVKIIVTDTGIGIAQDRIKDLFNKTFERGEEAKKTFATGTGLGLFLSNKIILAHGGKVWVESKGQGQGSTFYIELPIDTNSPAANGQIADAKGETQHAT
jgi:signal transduction histidine kinase